MYKTAGKFWGRNRSLAKRAITMAVADLRPQTQSLEGRATQPKKARQQKKHTTRKLDDVDNDKQHSNNEWRNRMEGHLIRWRSILEKKLAIIARLEKEISETEEMIQYAKGLGYSENDYRALDKKRRTLSDTKESVFTLEDKISSVSNELELNQHSRNRFATRKGLGKKNVEADVREKKQLNGDRHQQKH